MHILMIQIRFIYKLNISFARCQVGGLRIFYQDDDWRERLIKHITVDNYINQDKCIDVQAPSSGYHVPSQRVDLRYPQGEPQKLQRIHQSVDNRTHPKEPEGCSEHRNLFPTHH
jgi:hypothetical protein